MYNKIKTLVSNGLGLFIHKFDWHYRRVREILKNKHWEISK